MTKVCIATTKFPTDADKFTEELKGYAREADLELVAILGRIGFGCYNLGLKIEGDEEKAKKFVDALTMALMPARWCYCTDEFEGFVYEDLGTN